MSADKTKTLEQITQDVLNNHFGITDEDLTALFADTSTDKVERIADNVSTPPADQAQEPTQTSPPEQAATQGVEREAGEPSPPITKPGDRAGSTSADLDAKLKEQQEQIAQLQAMLASLQGAASLQATQQQQPSTVNAPEIAELEAINDQHIFEKPKENILKMVNAILRIALPAAFADYDRALATRAALEAFSRAHPDFDELRPIMRQIVLEDPARNDHPSALPRVYEEAKRRRAAMLEALKRELLPQTQQAPAATSAPALDEETLLSKLEQRIAEKLRKRRAGAGTASPTSQPLSPVERMSPNQREAPKSESDAILEAMLNVVAPSEKFLQNLTTTSQK